MPYIFLANYFSYYNVIIFSNSKTYSDSSECVLLFTSLKQNKRTIEFSLKESDYGEPVT